MSIVGQITVFLFLLSLGKSSADLREFNRIKGEWQVIRVQEGGKPSDMREWEGKKVVFALAREMKKPVPNAIEFVGRLNVRKKPFAFENGVVTAALPADNAATLENERETTLKAQKTRKIERMPMGSEHGAIYEVNGDSMKLLLHKYLSPKDKKPTKFVTTPGDYSILLELRRIKAEEKRIPAGHTEATENQHPARS